MEIEKTGVARPDANVNPVWVPPYHPNNDPPVNYATGPGIVWTRGLLHTVLG